MIDAPIIEVERLRKVFRLGGVDVPALRGVSLEIDSGEFAAVLGPSGSGKSTLFHVIGGMLAPTSGSVRLAGQELLHLTDAERTQLRKSLVGFVFQRFNLIATLTAEENIRIAQHIAGTASDDDRHLDQIIAILGIQHRMRHKPYALSGGEQQRVAIARALVFEPDLVLMDEPLGALDRRLREEMQYEIRRLQQRLGVTMIYVTHDQGEAMVLSDRVAVMDEGRIQQIAGPEALYEEPECRFVAGFIGENNLLDGQMEDWSEDGCRAKVGDRVVEAYPVAVGPDDARCTLAIRPERVALNPKPGSYRNTFEARVLDVIFVGDALRLHAELLGSEQFVVKIPNIVGHGAVLPGDTVTLGWLATDCRALDPR